MKLFVIADLHLSVGVDKPMDIFGPEWSDYMMRLRENWTATVQPEDTVLLPGDFSWAIDLKEVKADFDWLHALPGSKILTKGNHDYWWTTHRKLDAFLLENDYHDIRILHNEAVQVGTFAISGTRGWKIPGDEGFSAEDEKIYNREYERLERSLKDAERFQAKELIVVLHYPPFNGKREESTLISLMQAYGVSRCFYGHLHGKSRYMAVQGLVEGIDFKLVASDQLQFVPWHIVE